MRPAEYVAAIKGSGLSIYDPIEIGSAHYIPSPELESLLNSGLRGISTSGLPLRTRSKVVKTRICEVLGYPAPTSFAKTRPRFPGQNFDTYIQKSNNLQVWNEELSPTRRYVLIREVDGMLTRVRVVTGETLAKLDTTGTLTQKYQARLVPGRTSSELISVADTVTVRGLLRNPESKSKEALNEPPQALYGTSPTDYPKAGQLLSVNDIFARLVSLVGASFADTGRDQDRNRGAALHRLVCTKLGYSDYADDGRFPDVKHQLLEVKLQTSPTIDLGLVTPASTDPLDIPKIAEASVRHCDVRYAIFGARSDGDRVTINQFYLCTGVDFFTRFPRFEGKVLNKKLQIPLPHNLFEAESLTDVVV